MNPDLPLQSRDQVSENPLLPKEEPATNTAKATKNFQNLTPKVKILIALAILIVILLFLSLIVAVVKKNNNKPPTNSTPTPILSEDLSPTPTTDPQVNKLPENYKKEFEQIDYYIQSGVNFNPPQIDIDIGL